MKPITLERRFFAINEANESEFDWFLEEMGITETKDINEIDIKIEDYKLKN